ncbi:methyl-accepting chemotaxis protein [Rhizobium sp. A37_96]
MRLSDVAITKRILLSVCLPLLVVAGLSYDRLDRSFVAYRTADHLVDVTAYISNIADAIHQLQTERGESATLLGRKAAGTSDRLKSTRLDFDRLASMVARTGRAFENGGQRTGIGPEEFTKLTEFRRQVDGGAVTSDESYLFYTRLIGRFLDISHALAAQDTAGEMAAQIDGYNQLSGAKEFAGEERALGNAAISSRHIDAATILKFSSLYGGQAILLDEFRATNPALADEIEAVGPDRETALASMRRRLLVAGTDVDLSGWDAAQWHAAATERIDALHVLEGKVLASLRADAAGRAQRELRTLIFAGTILGLATGLALLLSISIGLGVVRPLKQLTKTVEQLAKGEADEASVALDSRDEIGALARAVDHAIEAARLRLTLGQEEEVRHLAQKQMEAAIVEQERAARSGELEQALHELNRGLRELASGNLRYRIDQELASGLEPLRLTYNQSTEALECLVLLAGNNARSIDAACTSLHAAAEDLARRTAGQAAALEEAAAALEEVVTAVKMSANGADEAKKSVDIARSDTSEATRIVGDTIAAMQAIARSSSQIGQIIGVIDEIAFQTNLLALNAGVEAARAGEAGKGFAVVAQEVRELAQRSAAAAREIKVLVEQASRDVAGGVALVGEAGEALGGIEGHVQMISQQISAIARSSTEQSVALGQITSTVGQLDQITQQNASMVERTNAATRSLAGQAEDLRIQLGAFRTGQQPASGKAPQRLAVA